jgi:hypothetical protein
LIEKYKMDREKKQMEIEKEIETEGDKVGGR